MLMFHYLFSRRMLTETGMATVKEKAAKLKTETVKLPTLAVEMRQEKPKRVRKKKVPAPVDLTHDLTHEEKSYIKLLGDRGVAWSTIYCPAIQKMLDKGLLE